MRELDVPGQVEGAVGVGGLTPVLSLRERRRRELRQQLSDVATRMFLERGFDAVRVADVARACGVTEKTVFNHFRSKESLLADRWDTQTEALCSLLADPSTSPVEAALRVLDAELAFMTAPARGDGDADLSEVRRFGELIGSTPSLVAHNREALDRLTAAAAGAIATRTGTGLDDPRPWITAAAIAGLWSVYYRSLRRHLANQPTAGQVRRRVHRDLQQAADTLHAGLR